MWHFNWETAWVWTLGTKSGVEIKVRQFVWCAQWGKCCFRASQVLNSQARTFCTRSLARIASMNVRSHLCSALIAHMYSHHVVSANHPGRYVSEFYFIVRSSMDVCIFCLVKKTVTVQTVWNRCHWILPVRFFKDTILCMHFFTAAFSAWLKNTSSLLRVCYLETDFHLWLCDRWCFWRCRLAFKLGWRGRRMEATEGWVDDWCYA